MARLFLTVARIILNTFGSLGDLHPYLAIAIGLRERGHQAVIATSEVYREKVLAEGVEFAPVRPDVGELLEQPELIEKLWDSRTGSEFLIREYILPQLEASYQDLVAACRGADLILTHVAGYAGPLAAEALQIRWLSVALQPMVFFSVYDPPVVPNAEWLRHLYWLGPAAFRAILAGGARRLDKWAAPIVKFRKRLGLPSSPGNPLLGGQFSPVGTLALFSPHFAPQQPDWPPHSKQTGFVFYDRHSQGRAGTDTKRDSSGLQHFLNSGPAPVLFTLGSSAVTHPGTFFRESMAAARMANVRAVLLTGLLDRTQLPQPLPDTVFVESYAPYSEIMPRAAAIVHQGGIGTTAQALRAGRPMLVVPWAHDQPDNALRLTKLGVARTVRRSRYAAPLVARELRGLLNESAYARRASLIGPEIAKDEGLRNGVDGVESFLRDCIFSAPAQESSAGLSDQPVRLSHDSGSGGKSFVG